MRRETIFYPLCLTVLFTVCFFAAESQPNTTIELKKTDKFQNRQLASEKTGNKKFTVPKRLYSNMVSQYNYYFNANAKLEDIIATAKAAHQEDYRQLLPFYNYSLEETAKGQIDTVLYKCTAGILLHDLRNDWVDRLYLLMGKAYLHRQDFDSAAMVLQYINYAFAPKDEGYDIPIGSNASNSNGIFTISSSEKRNFWKKISSKLPSRNESFLWQVRNYIEQNKLTEAGALLEIIRSDKLFPARLKTDWYEMEAYLQYTKQSNDSAAHYIILALDNAGTKSETARWEYLAAQLLELSGKHSASVKMYEKAIQHSTDPFMEVYARLHIVSLSSGKKSDALQENLNQLLLMAKRDKYQGYRDVIYYSAAELELKRNNYTAAEKWLLKSIQTNENNEDRKQQSFLLLADVSYSAKNYIHAAAYYDSIQAGILKEADQQTVDYRKTPLDSIALNIKAISNEDSLQKIAAMPVTDRSIFLKTLLRKIRKEQGLKETEPDISFGGNPVTAIPDNLFKPAGTDFYFGSSSLKAKGLSEFKTKWGSRPNIDNWRRQSAIDRSFSTTQDQPSQALADVAKPVAAREINLAALTEDLPLSAEALIASNTIVYKALMSNGYTFQYYLQDYPAAIECYESILRRFPETPATEELLFQLNSCYNKTGEFRKADALVKELSVQFPNGNLTKKLTALPVKNKISPAEQAYTAVYNAFLEGRFEQAITKKNQADEQFGKNYWTPQLLYIESVYYIKKKQDSIAINRLQNMVSLFPKTDMAEKASTMIDVLKRRNEIEAYLSNLDIERPVELIQRNVDLNNTNTTKIELPKIDTVAKSTPEKISAPVTLPEMVKPIAVITELTYAFAATDTQYVVLVLKKVDPIFIGEARNAFNRYNQTNYYQQRFSVSASPINDSVQYLLIGPFSNAADAVTYIDKTKPVTSSRIIPWLTADKYSYSLISPANLGLLRKKKDPAAYADFLHKLFPDKF